MIDPSFDKWLLVALLGMILLLGFLTFRRFRKAERWRAERRLEERREESRRASEDRRNDIRKEHDRTHNQSRREDERRAGERRQSDAWQEEYDALKLQLERNQHDHRES